MSATRAQICNKKGLHARAAAKVVKLAGTYDATLEIIRLSRTGETEEARAGATSILSLLMLAADNGSTVEIHASGAQAEEASAALVALIARRFDEEE